MSSHKTHAEVDLWNRDRWLSEFDACDCVVMTAQIWLNVIMHGYWQLERVRTYCASAYYCFS
jgi:hypothetical protein